LNTYAEKSVEEIITEEAKQGNTEAANYSRELFGDTDELIRSFKLAEPSNKYQIINSMDSNQLDKLLPLLDSEDLVLGLNFFTQEKLLKMFDKVPSIEAANVALGVFTLEQVVQMLPIEQLEKFFFNDDVEKEQVIKQLTRMPHEVLIQMVESITGEPANEDDSMALIASIASLPEKQYKETMANMDPTVQIQVIYQMAHDDNRILGLFDSYAYSQMIQQLQKPDMVKSMIGLEKESLQTMITELPKDLFATVATQIDTEVLANFLMSDCTDLLERFGSRQI